MNQQPDPSGEGTLSLLMEVDNERHCQDFVRLNELWITEHFSLEESDRKLAADPFAIVRDGGHILSLTDGGKVVGVCALFRESPQRYQLARMAVEPGERGKGYGEALVVAAIKMARDCGAQTLYLLSNTALGPAIALYRKQGFRTLSEGLHPAYARCNIVMELDL
jgi:N-acetylglutamate synthase-like GNAT family acetyltransferase